MKLVRISAGGRGRPVGDGLRESAVPNLSDRVGKRQLQSEIPGVVKVYYTVDYQNPDNFEEVAMTISPTVDGKVYKQTVTGWDEAFEVMGNLESSLSDAYREGIQNLLIDFSLAVSDDPASGDGTDGDWESGGIQIDHGSLRDRLKTIVGDIDVYVFDAIDREMSAQGFIPTEGQAR